MEEELQEEGQQDAGKESSSRLRSIERSPLRGAQAKVGVKRRSTTKRHSASAGTDRARRVRSRPKARRKRGSKRLLAFTVLIAIAIAVLFLLTTAFSTARLDLTLSSVELPIDGVFSAIREPAQSKDISYRRLPPFTEAREASITSVTRERQNTRAEGVAVLHNVNPSGESLDLVNRTRLQTEDGRIYRVIGDHTVPGGKKAKDGSFVSGTKEVKVEADSVGTKYNLLEAGTRLSVPGLSRYRGYADTYAVTKTRIVGGFSGERLIPDEDEDEVVRRQLRRDIEKTLRDSLAQSITNNSLTERVVFDGGVFIDFQSLENEQSDDSVLIREEGTLYAVSFREAELASLLSGYASSVSHSTPPMRVEVKDLSMKIEKRDDFDVISSTEFSFRLSGSATLFWDIDKTLFLNDVAGKTRVEAKDIIAGEYTQVKQVNNLSVFPAWRTSLPSNKDKIGVTVGY